MEGILDDEEMWNMVHYIRHLPPKGSLGAPGLYKEEEEEHEKMEHGGKAGGHKDANRTRIHIDLPCLPNKQNGSRKAPICIAECIVETRLSARKAQISTHCIHRELRFAESHWIGCRTRRRRCVAGGGSGTGVVAGGFTGTVDLCGVLGAALVSFPAALRTAATKASAACGVWTSQSGST